MPKQITNGVKSRRGLCIDLACLLFVGLAVIAFEFFGDPPKNGYFCDDNSIKYPLPNHSTVSTKVLILVVCIAPIFIILVVEVLRTVKTSTPRDSWQSVCTTVWGTLLRVYGVYMFGLGLTQVTMDTAKYTTGRLRPHFLDACRPKVDFCNTSAPNIWVTDYECTGDPHKVKFARLSFPSGHAAHSFYAAVFISMFLQYRLPWRQYKMPRHMLEAVVLLIAWYTALSRLHDHHHHFTDMVAGIIIGTTISLLTVLVVSDLKASSARPMSQEINFPLRAVHIQ